MEPRETDSEFNAAVDWVLAHPSREKVFPQWSDEQIKAAYRLCRQQDAALFFYGHQKQIVGTLLAAVYPEISRIHVLGVIGSKREIGRAVAAWAARYPTFQASGSRSGKCVFYPLKTLCRLLHLTQP